METRNLCCASYAGPVLAETAQCPYRQAPAEGAWDEPRRRLGPGLLDLVEALGAFVDRLNH